MEIPKRQLHPFLTGRACQGVCVYSDVMDHRVRGIILWSLRLKYSLVGYPRFGAEQRILALVRVLVLAIREL